mmetsp:Transcript_10958/g.26320  ORF Transcript_10958/g.26320 Transcript_10958/m.26320 type:complete len:349 (+) Transcript_10958:103-1149(+)
MTSSSFFRCSSILFRASCALACTSFACLSSRWLVAAFRSVSLATCASISCCRKACFFWKRSSSRARRSRRSRSFCLAYASIRASSARSMACSSSLARSRYWFASTTSACASLARSNSSRRWRASASASACAICLIISPSRRSSAIFLACSSFCCWICVLRTCATSCRLSNSSSSRKSSSASIRRMASCCFWYHRSSVAISFASCTFFSSSCRSRSCSTSESISLLCSAFTRSVESYSILFALSIASRRFSACSASSSLSISCRIRSSASSFSCRTLSFLSRLASMVFGHLAFRAFDSACRRSRSSCFCDISRPVERARKLMLWSSEALSTAASLSSGAERRARCTAVA